MHTNTLTFLSTKSRHTEKKTIEFYTFSGFIETFPRSYICRIFLFAIWKYDSSELKTKTKLDTETCATWVRACVGIDETMNSLCYAYEFSLA